jgi:hypothetical protein
LASASQYSENDEREKLNVNLSGSDINNNNNNFDSSNSDQLIKKSVETQVDYVTLLVARNCEDWKQEQQQQQQQQQQTQAQGQSLPQPQVKAQVDNQAGQPVAATASAAAATSPEASHPQSSLTIDAAGYNPVYRSIVKRNRTRLDSAPTVANKDLPDYEDVNLVSICFF